MILASLLAYYCKDYSFNHGIFKDDDDDDYEIKFI